MAKNFAVCVAGRSRGARFFADCVAGRARHNAARCAFILLLGISQEVAKKETQAFPLGTPRHPTRGSRRRVVCTGKSRAKFLLSRPVRNLCKQGGVANSKSFCNCILRDTSVLAFYIKMRAQNLNLLIFAKTLVARSVNSFCVAGIQRAKGPLVRFLGSFFAAWQRMNINAVQRSAKQYACQKEKTFKILANFFFLKAQCERL